MEQDQSTESEVACNVGQVLFDANKKNDLTHDEIWDDTILIQQYDEALACVRKKINNRLGTTESEQSEVNTQSDRDNKSLKKKKKKAKRKDSWHVGDFCRSKFSEDGEIYEASIVSLQAERGKARVRYVGYNNEEDVSMRNLLKSKGREARCRQEEMADDGQSEMSDFGSSMQDSDLQSDTDGERSSKMRKPTHHPKLPQSRMPPPSFFGANTHFNPPPFLPDLPPPPALAMDESDDPRTSEALHTMLMSWYMTGYHTGYYQGLKQVESKRQRSKQK